MNGKTTSKRHKTMATKSSLKSSLTPARRQAIRRHLIKELNKDAPKGYHAELTITYDIYTANLCFLGNFPSMAEARDPENWHWLDNFQRRMLKECFGPDGCYFKGYVLEYFWREDNGYDVKDGDIICTGWDLDEVLIDSEIEYGEP